MQENCIRGDYLVSRVWPKAGYGPFEHWVKIGKTSIFGEISAMRLPLVLFLVSFFSLPSLGHAQSPDLDRYTSSKGQRRARSSPEFSQEGSSWSERHPEFMQELTTGIYLYQIPSDPTNLISLPTQIMLQGFNYVPRYALWTREDILSLTAGTNLGLALQLSNLGSVFMINVPLNFELNLGRGSMTNNDDPVGIYAGLGVEYNFVNDLLPKAYMDVSGNVIETVNNLNQWGLQWTAGFRAKVAGRPYVLRISRTLGVPSQKVVLTHLGFGVSLF
jgi:hypothetical protein